MLKKKKKWERERESKTAKLNKKKTHTQKRAHFEDLNLKLIKIISPH